MSNKELSERPLENRTPFLILQTVQLLTSDRHPRRESKIKPTSDPVPATRPPLTRFRISAATYQLPSRFNCHAPLHMSYSIYPSCSPRTCTNRLICLRLPHSWILNTHLNHSLVINRLIETFNEPVHALLSLQYCYTEHT